MSHLTKFYRFLYVVNIKNGTWTYDVVALSGHRYFVVCIYVLHSRSKAGSCREPKHFIGGLDIGVYDFIRTWIAKVNQQRLVLTSFGG